jgi:cytoskeletal protein CcmA (bactofilin family)
MNILHGFLGMKKTNSVTFIGENTSFEGKLSFHGTLRIDGRFKGEIFSDGTLIIGERGIVEADINTDCAVISGEVHGNIRTASSTEIHPKGKVYGSIVTSSLVIHEGVIFEGNCIMEDRKIQELKELPETTDNKKGLIKFFPLLINKNNNDSTTKTDRPAKEAPDINDKVRYS